MYDVEFHEVLLNDGPIVQEVYYYLLLPETAVFTGVWLGADKEYAFQVSTRGAAQQVYREQLVVRQDPALLEQVSIDQQDISKTIASGSRQFL